MNLSDIIHSVMISFYVLFYSAAFIFNFNSIEIPIKASLQWVERKTVPAATEIMKITKRKALQSFSALNESQILCSVSLALCELRTEQIYHIIIASLAVHTSTIKEDWI